MRWRPVLLLGVPVLIVAGTFAHVRYDAARARAGLVPVAELGWSIGDRPARVEAERSVEVETERFEIAVLTDGAPVHRTVFEIDHDLYGGGFVGGLDLDGDGVPSLVLATRAGRSASRVIEPFADGVAERGFDELSAADWRAVRTRLDRVAPGPRTLTVVSVAVVWLLVGLLVYAIVALYSLTAMLLRRHRRS